MPKVRRRNILVLGRDDLADQVVDALRREGHRARRLDGRDQAELDLIRTAGPLDPAVPDLTPTASLRDPTAPGLTRTAIPRDPTPIDLTRTASPRDTTVLDLTPSASPAAPALTDTASPLDSTAPDLTRTASPLDSTAPGLTRTASPLDSTAPDLTRTASPLDPKALDLTPAVSPLDPAVLDPARTPVLILADPPDAPDLVARLLELARERASQLQPRWWSVMKAGRPAVGQQAGPAVGQAGRPSRPRPVQRLILMHPRDPAPALPACEPDDPLQIETFAIEDRAARAIFRRWPPHLGLDPGSEQVPHLLFLGFAPPARALLLQALLLAHYGQGRPRITLACDRHEAVATEFLAAYPQASSIADLRFAPLA